MEEEKNEDNGFMKEPQMTEKELVTIVNKQRNEKAVGVDGVRAEVLKFLIKSKNIEDQYLKCWNKCLDEIIKNDWLR